MWGETADASDVQQTIWPRAAAAAGILLDMMAFLKGALSQSGRSMTTSF